MTLRFNIKVVITIIIILINFGCSKKNSNDTNYENKQNDLKYSKIDNLPSPIIVMHYIKGSSCVKAGRYEDAIVEFEKLIEKDSKYSPAYFFMGYSYLRLIAEKIEEEKFMLENKEEINRLFKLSLDALQKVSKKDPENKYQFNELANSIIYRITKIKKEETFPMNSQALMHFLNAEKYYNSKEFDKAITYYLQAIKIEPTNALYYLMLGDAYYSKNNYIEAIYWYKKSLFINPVDPRAWYFLGDAFREIDLIEDALKCYTHSRKIDPNYIPSKSAMKHLQMSETKETESYELKRRFMSKDVNLDTFSFNYINKGIYDYWEKIYGSFTPALLYRKIELPKDVVILYNPEWSLQDEENKKRRSVGGQFDPKTGVVNYPKDMFLDPDFFVHDLTNVAHEATHQLKKMGFIKRDLPNAAAWGFISIWEMEMYGGIKNILDSNLRSLINAGRKIAIRDQELEKHLDNIYKYFDKIQGEPPESYVAGALLTGILIELSSGKADACKAYLSQIGKGESHAVALKMMKKVQMNSLKR